MRLAVCLRVAHVVPRFCDVMRPPRPHSGLDVTTGCPHAPGLPLRRGRDSQSGAPERVATPRATCRRSRQFAAGVVVFALAAAVVMVVMWTPHASKRFQVPHVSAARCYTRAGQPRHNTRIRRSLVDPCAADTELRTVAACVRLLTLMLVCDAHVAARGAGVYCGRPDVRQSP